ncbi:hypothetical protein Goshw_007665, partial [Gossypium schwendimanii]|nr:hypothetical protein [Gossypium schwendimanii]
RIVKENCNGCGIKCWRGAFRCGKCRFALAFACLTLLHSTLHKIDEHMLNLTYQDDKEQSYCDICEQERDPSLWYYYCSICDTSAHLKCILGEFSFLKDGSIVPFYYYKNNRDLKFFRKVDGYPEFVMSDLSITLGGWSLEEMLNDLRYTISTQEMSPREEIKSFVSLMTKAIL